MFFIPGSGWADVPVSEQAMGGSHQGAASSVHAQPSKNMKAAKPSAAEQLSLRLEAIETFRSTFVQSITDPEGHELQKVSGKLVVKKPGLFYWQVDPPYEQVVVANTQTLWVFDPDLEQVTVSDRKKLDNTPAQILSGDFSGLGEKYSVHVNQDNGYSTYALKALDGDVAAFTTIYFSFNEQGVLQLMTLVDKLDQKTTVNMNDQQVNTPVENTLFDFVAPEGTDIIHND